jgi:hypothetical protein
MNGVWLALENCDLNLSKRYQAIARRREVAALIRACRDRLGTMRGR